MATVRARLLVALLVVAAGVARGDLYHQLAQDDAAVDQMANVVGAGETQALVDHQLHKVQARRDKVADATAGLKARAKATYLALQRAEKEEADANNLRRHLKEQLEIVTAEDKEKKEVAEKAEEIAKKMQEMAAKADGAWKEVRAGKRKTAAGFAEAKTDYAQRKEAAKEAQTKRRQAEDKAQLASTRLAAADKDVRVLQQQLMMEREHREDREVEHAVREKRDSFSQKKYASISQLKSLEHALLRSNPELEVLRPRHGDRDLSDSTEGDARGQNLVGDLNRADDRDFAGS